MMPDIIKTKMEITPKSTQELAAQFTDVFKPDFGFGSSAIPEGTALTQIYLNAKAEVEQLLNSGATDEELARKMSTQYRDAERSGIVHVGRGINRIPVDARDDEYRRTIYEKYGYLGSLKYRRKSFEYDYRGPLRRFVDNNPIDSRDYRENLAQLGKRVIEIGGQDMDARERLSDEFRDGNFVFHSAKSNQIVSIVSDGSIRNLHSIFKKYERRKKAGSDENFPWRNSGYEGISWSMNGIDAMPGDRYHVAGFLANPAHVLKKDEQLTLPSRPAPFEVIQISRNIDANKFYLLKTQQEIIESIGFGESNSILSNLVSLKIALQNFREKSVMPDEMVFWDEPLMLQFIKKFSDDEISEKTKGKYHVGVDGIIEFSPTLLQQTDDEIPCAAVWIGSLIDSGEIDELPGFKGARTIREVVERMDEKTSDELIAKLNVLRKSVKNSIESEDAKIKEEAVPIEDMYFVAPKKDLQRWLDIFARSAHWPKGILAYDGQKVRLENFASTFRGDSAELNRQIRRVIPKKTQTIEWEQVILGRKDTPEIRGGFKRQVIAEEFLPRRKSITLNESGVLSSA